MATTKMKGRWAINDRLGLRPRDKRAHWVADEAQSSICGMLRLDAGDPVQVFATEQKCRAAGTRICGSCRQLTAVRPGFTGRKFS